MDILQNKIDFMGFIVVERANGNGDPLNGNSPRVDYDGYGEISDVCLKRKIRNRMQDFGANILVQSDDRCTDGHKSIESRIRGTESIEEFLPGKKKKEQEMDIAQLHQRVCSEWLDVRSFGQVFTTSKSSSIEGLSLGVRGAISIHNAVSLDPVEVIDMQITKSVNGIESKGKGSDTMGMKHFVKFGVYKMQGSINVQLAEKTGFTIEDSKTFEKALISIFEGDASSARPEGSMRLAKLYWIEHSNKTGIESSYVMHNAVRATLKEGVEVPRSFEDYIIDESFLKEIKDINVEIYENEKRIQ
jgi:CRISPR-associated protein Csd2